MNRHLTGDELTQFVHTVQTRHQAGETLWSIAAALDCSTSAIGRRLRLAGIRLNPHPGRPRMRFTPEQVAEMVRRYQAGASLSAIGTDFGVSDKPIGRALREAAVTIRPRGQRPDSFERSSI